jgi:hypothetical protein
MAIRKKKQTKKSPKRKPAARKKTTSKKQVSVSNRDAHWKAYKLLQAKVDKAWAKLQADVRKKAPIDVLVRNKNQLLLLLGECNYMVRECMRSDAKTKKRQ